MEQEGYCLVFEGKVLPGFSRREVINRVALRLGRSPENLKRLFCDRPVTVRRGLERKKALDQQRIFSKMGVRCHILPATEGRKPAAQPFAMEARAGGDQCPKCGNELTKFGTRVDDCPFCGIIISKYLRAGQA
ncbi:MAG: hypothetical protein ACOC0W_03740 [Desulfosalsimonas sp.]